MKLMFDNDQFDWTVIAGYYAMYHAVLAALLKIGIRATALPKTPKPLLRLT